MTDTDKALLELKSAAEWFKKHGKNTNTAIIGICERAAGEIKRQQGDIERLKGRVEATEISKQKLLSCFKTAKSEAIKEFAERFEKKIKDVEFTIGQTWEIQCALKQTLKEMTESVNYESSKTEGYEDGRSC